MINLRVLKRVALIAGNVFLALVLTHAGQVIWVPPAKAQTTALFIPADSLVYQGQLSGLDVQDTDTGLRLTANSTETVALVKTSSQVVSGATVQVSVPAFAYQATLTEVSSGVYRTSTALDVAIQTAADSQAMATADLQQWSIVPQSGTFTLGTVSMSQAQLPPLKLSSGLNQASLLSQQLGALPPVTGFIPNAGLSAQSAGSSYQLPVSLAMQAQLLDANNKPIANRTLTVTAAPNGLAVQTFTTRTDAHGTFTYNVTYPAVITVSGGSLQNVPGGFQLSGVTADQVTAFWWGGPDTGGTGSSDQTTQSNLGVPADPNASGGSDPVNIVTGNAYDVETDLAYPSLGMGVSFQRTYNSQDTSIGPFGRGWTHSYNLVMTQAQHDNNPMLTESTANGARITWTGQGQNPNFTPPAGVHGTLSIDQNDKTYTKRDKHGVVSHYRDGDQGGQIDSITDPNGNRMTFTYSGSQLTTIADTAGRTLTLTYDSTGRVTSLTDALGNAVAYAYDSSGMLAAVTYPDGAKVSYAYSGNGNLVQLTDPDNRVRTFNYDSQNRAVSFSYAAGMERTDFRYDSAHKRTILADAAGFQTVYGYQYIGDTAVINRIVDPMGGVESYTWDGDLNRTSATDALNHTYKMEYDSQGNLTAYTDPAGHRSTAQYEASFNQPTQITDVLGRPTAMSYDATGNLVSQRDAAGNVTSYTRDGHGLMTSRVDAAHNSMTFGYDGAGNLTQAVDALGQHASATFDGLGHELSITDTASHLTSFAYDQRYRAVKVTQADGTASTFAYDAVGNVVSITNPLGRASTFAYDQANHVVKMVDPLGDTTSFSYNSRGQMATFTDAVGDVITVTYSPAGDPIKAIRADGTFSLQQYDLAHEAVAATDADGNVTRYAYDPLKRLVRVTDALGGTTRYGFDAAGEQVSVTDANGHQTSAAYDADGRAISTTDALGHVTRLTYDAVSNLVSVVDPLGQTTSYGYDALQRPVQAAYADGTTVKFSYDTAGNISQVVDASGTTAYAYDSLNRLVSQSLPGNVTLGYTYDGAGNRSSLNTPVGSTTYAYDAANRLVQVGDPLGGKTTLTRDALGRLVKEVQPNGVVTSTTFDGAGRVTHVAAAGARGPQTDLGYTYDAAGNVVTVKRNGRQTALQYDALNRLTQVGYPGGPHIVYAYDAVGNRTSQTATGLNGNQGDVDSGDRTGESGNGTTNYTYDAADELLQAGGRKYSYDAAGQLTSSIGPAGTISYSWDARHRLAGVQTPSQQVGYGYDAYNRLVSRQSSDGTTIQNVFDGSQLLLERLKGASDGASHLTQFVGADGQVVSALRAPQGQGGGNQNGQREYYQYDGQGSVLAATNGAGAVNEKFAYSAWGAPLDGSGAGVRGEESDLSGDPAEQGAGFTGVGYIGQPYDATAGLSWFHARWYSPQLGRFLTRDPLPAAPGAPSTLNRYAYALDNPASLKDPTGLSVTTAISASAPSPTPSTSSTSTPQVSWLDAIVAGLGVALAIVGIIMLVWTAPLWLAIALVVIGVLLALYAIYRLFGNAPGPTFNSPFPWDPGNNHTISFFDVLIAVIGLALAITAIFLIGAAFSPLLLVLAIIGLLLALVGIYRLFGPAPGPTFPNPACNIGWC